MIGRLHPDEIEDLLHHQHIGRLACLVAGRPYIVPLTYAYAGDAIYGQMLPGTKLAALQADPHVCFEVEQRADAATWGSVVADGVYEELTEPAARHVALALLRNIGPNVVPGTDEAPGVVFRLRLTAKSGRFVAPEA